MNGNELAIKALKKMKIIIEDSDTVQGHIDADRILCDLLVELGYQDVVNAYDEVGKWYA